MAANRQRGSTSSNGLLKKGPRGRPPPKTKTNWDPRGWWIGRQICQGLGTKKETETGPNIPPIPYICFMAFRTPLARHRALSRAKRAAQRKIQRPKHIAPTRVRNSNSNNHEVPAVTRVQPGMQKMTKLWPKAVLPARANRAPEMASDSPNCSPAWPGSGDLSKSGSGQLAALCDICGARFWVCAGHRAN
jgi:hypothetical protein